MGGKAVSGERKDDLVWGNKRLPVCPPRDPSNRYWSTTDGGKTWVEDTAQLHQDKIDSGYYQLEFTAEEMILLVKNGVPDFTSDYGLFASGAGQINVDVFPDTPNVQFDVPPFDWIGAYGPTNDSPGQTDNQPDTGLGFAVKMSDAFRGGRCRWPDVRFAKRFRLINSGDPDAPDPAFMNSGDFTEADNEPFGNRTPQSDRVWSWQIELHTGNTLTEARDKILVGEVADGISYPENTGLVFGAQGPVSLEPDSSLPTFNERRDSIGYKIESIGQSMAIDILNAMEVFGLSNLGDGVDVVTGLNLRVEEDSGGETTYKINSAITGTPLQSWEGIVSLTGDKGPEVFVLNRPPEAEASEDGMGIQRSEILRFNAVFNHDSNDKGYLVRTDVLNSLIQDFNSSSDSMSDRVDAFASALRDEVLAMRNFWTDLAAFPEFVFGQYIEGSFNPNIQTGRLINYQGNFSPTSSQHPQVFDLTSFSDDLRNEFLDMGVAVSGGGIEEREFGFSTYIPESDRSIEVLWNDYDLYESSWGNAVVNQTATASTPAGEYYFIPQTVYQPRLAQPFASYFEYVLDLDDLIYDGETETFRVKFLCEYYITTAMAISPNFGGLDNPTSDPFGGETAIHHGVASGAAFMAPRELSDTSHPQYIPPLPRCEIKESNTAEMPYSFKPFDQLTNAGPLADKEVNMYFYYNESTVPEAPSDSNEVESIDLHESGAVLPYFWIGESAGR